MCVCKIMWQELAAYSTIWADKCWLCYKEGLSIWHRQDECVAYVELVTVDYYHTLIATQEIQNKKKAFLLCPKDLQCDYQVKGKRLDTHKWGQMQRNHWHASLV